MVILRMNDKYMQCINQRFCCMVFIMYNPNCSSRYLLVLVQMESRCRDGGRFSPLYTRRNKINQQERLNGILMAFASLTSMEISSIQMFRCNNARRDSETDWSWNQSDWISDHHKHHNHRLWRIYTSDNQGSDSEKIFNVTVHSQSLFLKAGYLCLIHACAFRRHNFQIHP